MRKKFEYKPQTSFIPYPDEILPPEFKYPLRYLELARPDRYPQYLDWGFVDNNEHGPMEWALRLHWKAEGWQYLDDIDPIPFARNGDWAAFFDGSDHSGDPRVVVVDLGNKRNSYKLRNFDAWLDRALRDSGLK